jgi:lysophospholipase L1-like esterase
VSITPFNSGIYGDQLTNYDREYEFSGRTLNNIAALIKQRCSVYGVHCVNCTENFLTNSEVEHLLLDKVHPSKKGHIVIAKKMYRRLKQFL